MGPTVLFNLFFNIFSTLLAKSFQLQLNKLFSNKHLIVLKLLRNAITANPIMFFLKNFDKWLESNYEKLGFR